MAILGGFRARDLPEAGTYEALRRALTHGRQDCRLLHAAASESAQTPEGLRTGANLFGPGHSPVMTSSTTSVARIREVCSVLLHDAAFVAASMSVVDSRHRLFRDGIENLGDPAVLATFDHNYTMTPANELALKDEFLRDAEHVDCIALPVCGLGFPNYGHFLYDGLPAVFLQAQLLSDLPLRIVGQRLSAWQQAILDALGLSPRYMEVRGPIVFRHVLTSTLTALHVSYPTSFIRPMFDFLRFRSGASSSLARRVFLTRGGHDDRRRLRNRTAVEATLAGLGFAIVRPDRLSFDEQIALCAGATFVIAETGAAMANIGFCHPGTKILEIQPERFVEGWARGMCLMFGHRWHLYVAKVDSEPLTDATGRSLDPNQHFAYDIDPLDLSRAVSAIDKV